MPFPAGAIPGRLIPCAEERENSETKRMNTTTHLPLSLTRNGCQCSCCCSAGLEAIIPVAHGPCQVNDGAFPGSTRSWRVRSRPRAAASRHPLPQNGASDIRPDFVVHEIGRSPPVPRPVAAVFEYLQSHACPTPRSFLVSARSNSAPMSAQIDSACSRCSRSSRRRPILSWVNSSW